ncbi:lysophospholipid acyltransferase family protein [Dyella sp. KRB-257]|uniref:lysophospholipid acyltransferase family protein n=1 Tax=Dyella sp. KRB-257 TaxID=3400915 RepID=UPI003C052803
MNGSPEASTRRLPWLGMRGLMLLAAHLPERVRPAAARRLGGVLVRLPLARRRIALDNLAIAFPHLDEPARRRILETSLGYWMQTTLELAACAERVISAGQLLRRVEIQGLAHLEQALAQGHGVIAMTAHFGNFPWIALALAARGYPVAAVYKEANDFVPDFFGRIMQDYGVTPIRVIGRKRAGLARPILGALREGRIVLMHMDQSTPNGLPVPFFGRSAWTPSGPVVLARRSGATILPMFMHHQGGGHRLAIQAPYPLGQQADGALQEDLQRLSAVIEQAVRAEPQEWYWVHRRWKRPSRADAKA